MKHPIMFVGTGSDVGKSVINAAFCRIFLQDGYCPAPFKAQNMSLNSFATPDGLEIGRAQAVQAEACGIECSSEMNPILLKPMSNNSSQLVLNGKVLGNRSAIEYFKETDKEILFAEAMKAYNKLSEKYYPIVIEGAGSISELNLREKDITNMRIALATKAATYLIADIDKGGVFASVFGTIQLLPSQERSLIKGIIINKFRGDVNLFAEGRAILEKLIGIPVVGIIPYFKDIYIDDEDSVALDRKRSEIENDRINIVVVLLKHMSNFTDFNMLERIDDVHLFYTSSADDISNADIVIIPGSKNTISDLQYLQKSGLAKAITLAHNSGKSVYGICGGFQMMGLEVRDPSHVEGDIDVLPGLGILPVITTLMEEKITEQCEFVFLEDSTICSGYEIHMGETTSDKASPLCMISGKSYDGYFLNHKTWGTYIHGVFDNISVVKNIIDLVGGKVDIDFNFNDFKEEQYDKLADVVRDNVDVQLVYKSLRE